MRIRDLIAPGLCLALAVACGSDQPQHVAVEIPDGISTRSTSLLRLPAGGGEPVLYRPDSLARIDWNGPDRMPAIVLPLGFDPDDEMVYGAAENGAIIGLDLLARRSRSFLNRSEVQFGTPDGIIVALDSARRPLRFDNRTATTYRATVEPGSVQLVRGTGGRISAYNPAAGVLQVLSEEGELRRYRVPAGQLSSTWFGDLLAIANDSGITTIRPAVDSVPQFTRIRGNPVAAVLSPSAHRIYVARGRGDLILLDRFTLNEVGSVDLPGVARELRPDRSGRWLLARAETGDTVWVVDIVAQRLVATLATTWRSDLPLISHGSTLVARSGDDVAGWDITSSALRPTGRITGGGADHYLIIDWRPRGARPVTVEAPAAELAMDDTPSEPENPATGRKEDQDTGEEGDKEQQGGEIFIQVTASQNEGYARALARQLSDIGFRARVRDPVGDGAGYRVVVGPYPSRDEAETDGRRLGRPYFITVPQSRQQ